MDSIDFDNVKAEKAKALQRYNRFRRIGSFFRAAEIFFAILFIIWTFTRLPFVVQISGAFLRRIAAVISTPLFVFLLGNSIVVVLVTKSSDQTTAESVRTENKVYQAFVRSVENQSKPSDDEDVVTEENTVYQDKEMIVTCSGPGPEGMFISKRVEVDSNCSSQVKVYGRSKSDVSAKQSQDLVIKRTLQRSETEKCRDDSKEDASDDNYPEDNLSNEEFQKTIEAFIAKQLMFRRQESLAVVVHNKAV